MGLEGFHVEVLDKQRNKNDVVIVYYSERLLVTAEQVILIDVYGIRVDFVYRGDLLSY